MQITTYDTREEWLQARRGKITGSRLKDIIVKRGNGKKKGYYELIAERLATEESGDETPMDRGTRLEPEAMKRFIQETKKKVDTSLVIWERDDNASIAISPDGFIGKTEAVEVKCLSSASHLEAWLTQQIPSEYEEQAIQYFIVNDNLKKLYFTFYDPRITFKDYFVLEIERKQIEEKIAEYLNYQRTILAEIDEIVLKLSNF